MGCPLDSDSTEKIEKPSVSTGSRVYYYGVCQQAQCVKTEQLRVPRSSARITGVMGFPPPLSTVFPGTITALHMIPPPLKNGLGIE